jgi:hypothetical protein
MALSLVCHVAGAELVRVEKSAEAMGSTFGVIAYGSSDFAVEEARDRCGLVEAQRLTGCSRITFRTASGARSIAMPESGR